MKTELIGQYGHTWRMLEGIVKDFDEDSWLHTGRGAITPARTALHILQGVKYYIEDSTTVAFASGRPVDCSWQTANQNELPSQGDVLACACALKARTDEWISAIDLDADNESFDWTGTTKFSVVMFLLRHSLYHIGELSSLLNESRHGEAEDNWYKAL
ncbi:MAG: hypothetical protein ACXWN4_07135 [Candidatus Limnocylindrales bacterium]